MTAGGVGLPGVEVAVLEARAWMRQQFQPGTASQLSLPSAHLGDQLDRFTVARVLGASRTADTVLNGVGHGSTTTSQDVNAVWPWVGARGGSVLVVEDDLARRGDPDLRPGPRPAGVAFVGELVLRWTDLTGLTASSEEAAALLVDGSSGYSCIAYVCHGRSSELGLSDGRSLAPSDIDRVAAAVSVVLTSVWDAESYLLMCSDGETG